jgi:hypothetical protein
MTGQNAVAGAFCCNVPLLLQQFESLGENCDFGVVQRAAGIEPFGLFRFAACSAADLATLLQTQFEPLGEPEDIWLDTTGPRQEYCVKSRRTSFEAHTDSYAGEHEAGAVQAEQTRRIRFLKAQLLRDLAHGRKIFVFKGDAAPETMRQLTAQLQAHGPNHLLWVSVAGAAHPPGSVTRVSDGLLQGFVSHFGTYDGDPSLPVADWIAVTANAYRFCHHSDPPGGPLENLIWSAAATKSCQWLTDHAALTRRTAEAGPAGDGAMEHTLLTGGANQVYSASLPVDHGGNFVFSAWIRIPETFRGKQISAVLPGFPTAAAWPADFKSRGQWQRIWARANLPDDAKSVSCGIVADAATNDVFHSTSWCLERGTRPLGYGFVL